MATWRADLIDAFRLLDYDFGNAPLRPGDRTRGFSNDGILEISADQASCVSLLFSVDTQARSMARSAVALATIDKILDLGFLDWLSDQVGRHRRDHPWTCRGRFGVTSVTLKYFAGDAMLVSVGGVAFAKFPARRAAEMSDLQASP